MKVLYDPFCFSEFYGGVSRYFSEVIRHLPDDIQYSIPIKYTNNEYFSMLGLQYKEFFKNKRFKGQCTFTKLLNIPELKRVIRKENFDIYHQTHYDTFVFDLLPKSTKKIVTIHDLNFFAIPQFYEPNSPLKMKQVESIKKADHIITVSENTKLDLIKFFNIPDTSISVIYHGVTKVVEDIQPYKTDKPYLLFVGARYAYKNFENCVKAFSLINKNKDYYLICTGSPLNTSEIELFKKLDVYDSVRQIRATEQVLCSLYRGALCFIYPSYYEGFGIPLLEAMSNKCPIICSDKSCFPEVASDAALYFDPSSIEEIAERINQIIMDDRLRENLVENGLNRVINYSWEKSAKQHYELYKSLNNEQ